MFDKISVIQFIKKDGISKIAVTVFWVTLGLYINWHCFPDHRAKLKWFEVILSFAGLIFYTSVHYFLVSAIWYIVSTRNKKSKKYIRRVTLMILASLSTTYLFYMESESGDMTYKTTPILIFGKNLSQDLIRHLNEFFSAFCFIGGIYTIFIYAVFTGLFYLVFEGFLGKRV